MLKRIGLIGDVHAEADKLEAALRFFAPQNLDAILCTGDVCDGAGDFNDCCALLIENDVQAVRGNHDRWLLANVARDLSDATPCCDASEKSLRFLAELPATRTFETVAGKLLLCHGVGANDMARVAGDDFGYALEANAELLELFDSDYELMIGGHTHRRMVRAFDELLVINAGTLFRAHEPCCATVDFAKCFVQFHDFEDEIFVPNCERLEW